jgi:hypothetical protein
MPFHRHETDFKQLQTDRDLPEFERPGVMIRRSLGANWQSLEGFDMDFLHY